MTISYTTGFPITGAQARIVNFVSDRRVSPKLRVTRIVGLKNQIIGRDGEDKPITQAMTILIDFKNLTDEQVAQLTVGSLIQFDGELMENRFVPEGSETPVSYHSLEAWAFIKTARSKAERQAGRPVAADAMPAPMPVPMPKHEMAVAAPVAEPASYDDIPF